MQNIDNLNHLFTINQVVFYSFSSLALLSALAVIWAKNSVRAVLFLVLTFFATAGLWMTLQAEFLSVILILVYVGAVMVLFLFVVMMLDIDSATLGAGYTRYLPLGLLVSVGFTVSLIWAFSESAGFNKNSMAAHAADYSNIQVLGELLFTEYLYPLEIAGILLLVAMIAAISLTLRERGDTRSQNPGWQVSVRKADRLNLIKMTKETAVFVENSSLKNANTPGELQ